MHVAYNKYKLKETVNTKYISSRELKTSEFLRVRSTSENSHVFNTLDEIYLVFTSKSTNALYLFFYYPTVYIRSIFFNFCYVMSYRTIDQAIFSTIDWHYTMAWFPVSLLEHTDTYQHARRRCTYGSFMKGDVMQQWLKMRHGLASLNSNNSVVYGQKH